MSTAPSFDFRAFLDANWKSSGDVSRFLASYAVDQRVPCVAKWRERQSVPAQSFALLVVLLEIEKGQPISLSPYLK
ncbi:MAG TPA: hypothetical protein VMJ73_12240 [Rhizomicrobium sp.]|nr:hypothetical protein [Rhizomicrobium sp.]